MDEEWGGHQTNPHKNSEIELREVRNSDYTLRERTSPMNENYMPSNTQDINKYLRYPTFRTKEGRRPTFGKTSQDEDLTRSQSGMNLMKESNLSADTYKDVYGKRKSTHIRPNIPRIKEIDLKQLSPARRNKKSWHDLNKGSSGSGNSYK
jgi:hypothetical protein